MQSRQKEATSDNFFEKISCITVFRYCEGVFLITLPRSAKHYQTSIKNCRLIL